MARQVTGRDGKVWRVRRHWTGRLGSESLWRRFWTKFRNSMKRTSDLADADPGCLELLGEGVVVVIAIVVAALFLVFVGFPLLFALLDLVLIILLALIGTIARVVFRRPWTIEARPEASGRGIEWRVVGWRASRAFIGEVERRLESGEALPSTSTGPPVI